MTKVYIHFLFVSFLFVVLSACNTNRVTSIQEWENAPAKDWQLIPLNEKAYCSDSSDYFIFSKKGKSDNLIIHFAGGGACWDDYTCSRPFNLWKGIQLGIGHELNGYYISTATKNVPLYIGGLLSDKDKNPINDWNMVYIPYCTADLHLGDATRTYINEKGDSTSFHHNGSNNIKAALDWVYKIYGKQQKVLVTGDSAGGYAAMIYTEQIAKQYEEAKMYQLVDCSYALVDEWQELAKQWNAPLATKYEAYKSFLDGVYFADSGLKDDITFLQISSVYDFVLPQFRAKLEDSKEDKKTLIDNWSTEMRQATDRFRQSDLDYRFFLTDYDYNKRKEDTPHTFINFNSQFFKCEQDGVKLSDWVKKNIVEEEAYNVGEQFLATNANS